MYVPIDNLSYLCVYNDILALLAVTLNEFSTAALSSSSSISSSALLSAYAGWYDVGREGGRINKCHKAVSQMLIHVYIRIYVCMCA